MKFIFPQNYDFKYKFLGLFDYSTIILNIIWNLFIIFIIHFFNSLNIKIFFFIIFSLPLLLFSFSGFNGESLVYILTYIIKYLFKQKIYLYEKK